VKKAREVGVARDAPRLEVAGMRLEGPADFAIMIGTSSSKHNAFANMSREARDSWGEQIEGSMVPQSSTFRRH
jgi:hypothetical protein